MLCPFCLHEVDRFGEIPQPDDSNSVQYLTCPRKDCGAEAIPPLYRVDYANHPALPVSLLGMKGHGKSAFVLGLFHALRQVGLRWKPFSYSWLDEVQMNEILALLTALAEGTLEMEETLAVFPRPQVLRLSRVPRVGGCQLAVFDTGGEAFDSVETLCDAGKYVRYSRAVVWLASLADLTDPGEVDAKFQIYYQAMAAMNADVGCQTLVLTLTKGDRLLNRPDLPNSARSFLDADRLDPTDGSWQRLEVLSDDLQTWLERSGFHNLVHLARERFRAVRFCIVSSGTQADDGSKRLKVDPRGILAPLFWLWREQRPSIRVESCGQIDYYLSLQEAVANAPVGAVLRLEPATYDLSETLPLLRPLTLESGGYQKSLLRSTAATCAVGIKCAPELADATAVETHVAAVPVAAPVADRVILRGLDILHQGEAAADVVRVFRGKAELRACRIRGGRRDTQRGVPGDGVCAARDAAVLVANCELLKNVGNGIGAYEDARAEVVDGSCNHNGLSGVHFNSRVAGRATGVTCDHNKRGATLTNGRADLEGNFFRNNQGPGVCLENYSLGDLRHNECGKNEGAGVEISGQSAPALEDNKCLQNKGPGIAYRCEARGTARDNKCLANQGDGIVATDKAGPTLEQNECQGNKKSGIRFDRDARGSCRGIACRGNGRDGVSVGDRAAPEIDDMTCEENADFGIAVDNSAAPRLGRKNRCPRNGKGDIRDDRGRRWFGVLRSCFRAATRLLTRSARPVRS